MKEQVSGTPGSTMSQSGAVDQQAVEEKAQAYWRTNITVILSLLSIWFVVSYICGIALAVPLQNVTIGALPFGFWFAQQGAIYVFVLIILSYALIMDRVDRKFEVNE